MSPYPLEPARALGPMRFVVTTYPSRDEALVLFKTVPKRVGALLRHLEVVHPYDVPEVVELDIPRVGAAYLRYLATTLDPEASFPPLGGGAPPTRPGARRGRGARPPGRTRAPPPRRSR